LNILFAILGRYREIIPIQVAGVTIHWAIFAAIYIKGRAWLGQGSTRISAQP
jgi:hypothetical protein